MRVLVAYESNSGSTEEVARAVGETLESENIHVEVRGAGELEEIGGYDAVVIGAPMIVGWHRRAVRFIRRHHRRLSRIPVAYFMTALNLTDRGRLEEFDGIRITVDPTLLKTPKNPERLGFKERHNTLENYLRPTLRKAPKIRPFAVGLFAGKLEYRKLKLPQMVFVMLLFAEKPRDYRNWDAIRRWAEGIADRLSAEQ